MFLLAASSNLILFIAGVLQGILLGTLTYFYPKTEKPVNIFLSFYILCISILMLIPVVWQLFSWKAMFYLMPFPFLIGPFLYLYVRSFKETITWRKAWPHFLLFFIFLILDYVFLALHFFRDPLFYEMPEEALLNSSSNIRISIRTIRDLQMIIYYFLALKSLTSYKKSIVDGSSEVSRIDLDRLKWVVNGFLFLIIALLCLFYFVVRYPNRFELLVGINMAMVTPYLYLITIKAMTR